MNKKQLEKMLRLSDIKKTPINESRSNSTFDLIKNGADGNTYAIVRENRTYFIKIAKTAKTLTESNFDFIGGIQNSTKNSFRGFDDAATRLNIMFNDINRVNNIRENVDMKTFDYVLNEDGVFEGGDIRRQNAEYKAKGPYIDRGENDEGLKKEGCDDLDECGEEEGGDELMMDGVESLQEKKFILKLPKAKKTPAPEEDFGGGEETTDDFDFGGDEESTDEEGGDEFDFGGDEESTGEEGGDEFDFGGDEESTDEEGGDEFDFDSEEGGDTEGEDEFDFGGDEESTDDETGLSTGGDNIKDIQRTTGKLGQQLRDTEDITSDMQKWVAKSVISALNLNAMDDADKQDVISTLENGGEDEESTDEADIDFMDDDLDYGPVTYAGGRTLDDERGGEPELEDGEEVLLDYDWGEEGPGGYLGSKQDSSDSERIPMKDIEMGIQHKGYLNLDYEKEDIDYMGEDDEDKSVYDWNTSSTDPSDVDYQGRLNQRDFDKADSEKRDLARKETADLRHNSYMTDDMMEDCEEGGCGEVEEGMSKWNDADEEGGIGWETNEEVSYMDDEYTDDDVSRLFDNTDNNVDSYTMNNPQETPAQPTTKPDTDAPRPTTRPSKTPFTPPPGITPEDLPAPKARKKGQDRRVDYMGAEPRPSQDPNESPTIAPTKPGTDRPTTRPSKTPFTPPPGITPEDLPAPKARKRPSPFKRPGTDYNSGVEFS